MSFLSNGDYLIYLQRLFRLRYCINGFQCRVNFIPFTLHHSGCPICIMIDVFFQILFIFHNRIQNRCSMYPSQPPDDIKSCRLHISAQHIFGRPQSINLVFPIRVETVMASSQTYMKWNPLFSGCLTQALKSS